MTAELLSLTPTTDQRAKMAYVYIRQSSLMQVTRHAESTDLQYSLVQRAVALGWPRERVELIDEDQGKSGAQAEARGGFQRLLAESSLARVGLVLSFDASRLARNNRDWYQLLEVCSIFGTLIADGERLYDPRLYHDRLLLGLYISLPDTFWLERIGREKEEANEIVPTKRNKRSAWRNDLNECIDDIMGEVARASQGDGARSAWTPEENVSAVCLGHCPVAECGVATDGRRDCAAWDQRGEDAQHRTPLCALRRQRAR